MIEFITPTFNNFTLNFPPEPAVPSAIAEHIKIMDAMHDAVARDQAKVNAAERKARWARLRLRAVVAGGFHLYGRSLHYAPSILALAGPTRAERRRAKFGRM